MDNTRGQWWRWIGSLLVKVICNNWFGRCWIISRHFHGRTERLAKGRCGGIETSSFRRMHGIDGVDDDSDNDDMFQQMMKDERDEFGIKSNRVRVAGVQTQKGSSNFAA